MAELWSSGMWVVIFSCGMACVIGGIVLAWEAIDRRHCRVEDLEERMETAEQMIEMFAEREEKRKQALRERKRLKKEAAGDTITLSTNDQVNFYKSAMETIDGL